jgi:hypothetical protein
MAARPNSIGGDMAKIGRGYAWKDGKIVPKEKGARSASEAIRMKKSKRQRVVSPAKARMATKAQRP